MSHTLNIKDLGAPIDDEGKTTPIELELAEIMTITIAVDTLLESARAQNKTGAIKVLSALFLKMQKGHLDIGRQLAAEGKLEPEAVVQAEKLYNLASEYGKRH